MPVTMKDVATKANVSPTTVSLVLNGRDRDYKISQKTRQKVLKVIQDVGYVPDLYAQTMRQRETLTIGMVLTNILNPSVALIAEGAKAEAVKHGYHVILGLSSDEADQERFYVKNFLSRRVDGLIVSPAPSGETMGDLEKLFSRGFPLVVTTLYPGVEIDHVGDNSVTGSYQAVKYLVELGHKRIALVSGYPTWPSAQQKYRGYQDALNDMEIDQQEDLHICMEKSDQAAGEEAAAVILQMKDKPDAIFFHNDGMAAGAINVLMNAGIRVPDDISLVGYGDLPLAQIVRVPLTTVSSPLLEIGRSAVEVLISRIQCDKEKKGTANISRPPQSVQLMPKLIIRDSTAPRK